MRTRKFISLSISIILICSLNFSCSKKEQIRKDEPKSSVVENTNKNNNISVGEQSKSEEAIDAAKADILPKMINDPNPVYPSKAKKNGVIAKVILRVLLDENGEPKEVIVLKCICNSEKYYDEFTEAAKEEIMKARWTPAYNDNKPVPVWIIFLIKFELD